MNEIVNLFYVPDNVLLTLTNIFVFVYMLEFFLCIINILRGVGK